MIERHLIESLADAELRAVDLCGGYRQQVSILLEEVYNLRSQVQRLKDKSARQETTIREFISAER